MFQMSSFMQRALIVIAAGTLLTLAGCEDEQADNADCEAEAVSKYSAALPGCEEDIVDCIDECTDTDLESCVGDCEDDGFACFTNFSFDLTSCGCFEKTADCMFDCNLEDFGCITDCGQFYLDCAGADSPFTCSNLCDFDASMCQSDCESDSTDADNYLQCRGECNTPLYACLDECV